MQCPVFFHLSLKVQGSLNVTWFSLAGGLKPSEIGHGNFASSYESESWSTVTF